MSKGRSRKGSRMIGSLPARCLSLLVVSLLLCLHIPVGMALCKEAPTVQDLYPDLATGILKWAIPEEMDQDILLKGDGIEIDTSFAGETLSRVPPQMREEFEKNTFYLLEREATRRLIRRDARSMGISTDLSEKELGRAYLDRITKEVKVTGAEARAFYEKNREALGKRPFEDMKEGIEPLLLQRKRENTISAHIAGLAKEAHLRLNREWVKKQARLALDNPVDRAKMSGKPTVVQFGATGCEPCDLMQPILERLRKKYPDDLNVLFINVRKKPIMGARFRIQSIPVQVFYNAKGKEVLRHRGFFAESEVLKQVERLGVE